VRSVRPTSVAGSWYPDDPVRLRAELDRYVAGADIHPPPRRPLALIAPHAGLMYSGPVAAFAYKAVRDTGFTTVVLVGPSHFVPFDGVAVWPEGGWETPFGRIAVDGGLAAAIGRESDCVVEFPAAHGREHSLEMQLPFVAHLLPGAAIVPLVIGRQTRATAFALGDALARAVAASRPGVALIVASSDLSHYEDARTAAALDGVIARHVEDLDAPALMESLEHEPRHACGGGAMVAVLHAARQLGATTARVLRYGDSGDVSGDKSSVVGYMAAGIW
jgi:AmmeMemoRadiSam system protein B